MAGRGKAGSFPRRTSWKTRGGGRGGHLPACPGISGTLAGDAGADGLFAQVPEPDGRAALWINPGFGDLRLALGVSGFHSPVKVWCRKKLNEPYCKDFALKQKIFNALGLSCWEHSFPSAAVHVDGQGFGDAGGCPGCSPPHG